MRTRICLALIACLSIALSSSAYENYVEADQDGEAKLAKGDYEGAVQAFSASARLAKLERRKVRAASRLEEAQRLRDQWLINNAPGHPYHRCRELYAEGYELFTDHKYAQARNAFSKVLDVKGGYPAYLAAAQFRTGYCWFCEKGYGKARGAFAKVLEVKDSPPVYAAKAHQYMGKCLVFEGNFEDAAEAMGKARDIVDAQDRPSREENAIKTAVEKQLKALSMGLLKR